MRLVTAILLSFVLGSAGWASESEPVSFSRKIRPILSDKCFACHGPDDKSREGGFRLDVREQAMAEADSGVPPIVAGDPAASELVRRITADDESELMPPPDSNKTLSTEEITLLQQWIAQGAKWEKHWSFIPLQRTEPPKATLADETTSAIDRFLLARLERAGLKPSPETDRVTLIRRVSFDLTGLPPTPEEVRTFVTDNRPDAYERLVDRLLASTRYGEHMARYWLDAARYGDTHGLHLDNYREMWPYRDWVVRAFNNNMPFDQFTLEQLAGDLLPEPSNEQLVATGFNRCHVTTSEGGSITEEVYVRNVVDRVETFGTVFLGLTIGCTRCHDHKYDPLTMHDFYSLFAYFNSLDGKALDDNRKDPPPVLRAPSPDQEKRLAEINQLIADLETQLYTDDPALDAEQTAWEQQIAPMYVSLNQEIGLDSNKQTAPASSYLTLGEWQWVGPFSANKRYLQSQKQGPEGKELNLAEEFEISTGKKISWKPRPDWVDGKVHNDLPGAPAANFISRSIVASTAQELDVSLGSDDGVVVYLNGEQVFKNFTDRAAAADQEKLTLKLRPGENQLLIKILNYQGVSGFYFKITSDQTIIPGDLLELVRQSPGERTEEQRQKLRHYFRNQISQSAQVVEIRQRLADVRTQHAELDRQVGLTLVWKEKKEPRPAFILNRGEYDQRGEQVARQTPSILPSLPAGAPNDRLGLARWLVDPGHPLTARVAVNRFWQQVFGTGLVKTSDDFGSQGEPPSHPELLDWLALNLMDSDWDVKAFVKSLVTSAAYRQTVRVAPDAYRVDPENRLLARGPRYRLDGEMLRDQALAASGLLVNHLGGPSVKPPQPKGLWFAVGYSGSNTVRFTADKGHDKVHRRSLYTFIKRTSPPPQMSAFDGPSRESCTVRRERTNTPLQALLLLNDPQYVEAARALAERVLGEAGPSDEQRAALMFQLCTCRSPNVEELAELVQAFRTELRHYRQQSTKAEQLVAIGETKPAEHLDRAELAAWTLVANVLLNLDEVVTKN